MCLRYITPSLFSTAVFSGSFESSMLCMQIWNLCAVHVPTKLRNSGLRTYVAQKIRTQLKSAITMGTYCSSSS